MLEWLAFTCLNYPFTVTMVLWAVSFYNGIYNMNMYTELTSRHSLLMFTQNSLLPCYYIYHYVWCCKIICLNYKFFSTPLSLKKIEICGNIHEHVTQSGSHIIQLHSLWLHLNIKVTLRHQNGTNVKKMTTKKML